MSTLTQDTTRERQTTTATATVADTTRTTSQTGRREHFGVAPTLGIVLPLRVFLAAGWLRAGAEKLGDRSWASGTTLRGFLHKQHDSALPFFRPVMDHLIAPGARMVALTVLATQLLCGALIASGRHMKGALRWACVMNIVFIMAGRVNPSAFYLVMQIVLLFALADGALGAARSHPTRRTFTAAAVAATAGALMVPYVRTLEPAKVIDDPAMMLAFLGLVSATTLLVRFASYPQHHASSLGRLWTWRLAGWSHATEHPARHAPAVRTDLPQQATRTVV